MGDGLAERNVIGAERIHIGWSWNHADLLRNSGFTDKDKCINTALMYLSTQYEHWDYYLPSSTFLFHVHVPPQATSAMRVTSASNRL